MKILVVDDEEAIRKSIGALMVHLGHQCRMASNGREALKLLQDEWVDVLICDFVMPVFNGLELLGTIRKQFPDQMISIIMISGQTAMDDAQQAYELGAKWVLQKPLGRGVLKDLLTSLESDLW
jgi:CheY-like chemotaxis protein